MNSIHGAPVMIIVLIVILPFYEWGTIQYNTIVLSSQWWMGLNELLHVKRWTRFLAQREFS